MFLRQIATKLKNRRVLSLLAAVLVGAGVLAAAFVFLRRFRARDKKDPRPGFGAVAPLSKDIQGLSEAEVERNRSLGQNTELRPPPRRTRQQIIRDSTFTVFNLNLAVLSLMQLVLTKPLDALITLGVMALNIGVNVFQVEFADRRLRSVQELARIQATVIRDGKVRGIDPGEIVVADVLAAATGDQLMVDGTIIGEGQLLVDESIISGDSTHVRKQAGDLVYAGSACISGRAAYRAEKIGDEREIVKHLQVITTDQEELTPIERILNRIMRILLVIVFLLGAVLVGVYYIRDTNVDPVKFADSLSVIFGIAPASLFFMVVLTYVAGTADLAAKGALVHRSRSVESLAQADVLCFAGTGILTGAEFEIALASDAEKPGSLAESRIQQMLGDYAANTSANNLITQTMASTYSGSRHTVGEEAPFLAVYGWSALVFDDDDVRGVYVLAEPELLQADEKTGEDKAAGEEESEPIQKRVLALPGRFGRILRREVPQPATGDEELQAPVNQADGDQRVDDGKDRLKDEDQSGGFFRRFRKRIDTMLDVVEVKPEMLNIEEDVPEGATRLVFAYTPDIPSLYSKDLEPQLPVDLIPLCYLTYRERVRPEMVKAIQDFTDRGVAIKLFSASPPEETLTLLREGGLAEEQLQAITGSDFSSLDAEEQVKAVDEHAVFGQFSHQHLDAVVQLLNTDGRSAAMIGEKVNDMSAMRHADLSIASLSSYPAVFNSADIVLLNDSPTILSGVVDRGQRIVNGLLDILKLNLTQVFSTLLLVVAVFALARGFPITGAQSGIVAFITLALPALGLTLWADAGIQPTKNLSRLLIRFIAPAAIMMTVTAFVIYTLFFSRSGQLEYAQVGVTHVLVAMGLVLVLFIKPPVYFRPWTTLQPGDLRPTLMVFAGALLFLAITLIPLISDLLNVDPLQEPSHYLIIAQATIAWAIALKFVWLLIPLGRRVIVRADKDSEAAH
ncbi:MAG: HAD-IC family P-type ATPase [Chloroflexi bacterium]|nr:HAD-IC family P-type ATPase [Chloroflexota bacterium]